MTTLNQTPEQHACELFNFHRPAILASWLAEGSSLHARLQQLPALNTEGLHDCQITAITNLEASLKQDKPRAPIQIAIGSGKIFTVITLHYFLRKYARAHTTQRSLTG